MNEKAPHIIQYQGSKRLLAPQILQYMPRSFNRLIEPFAGMAALTIASANENRAGRYYVNDVNEPLVHLLQAAVNTPADLATKYAQVWGEQFDYPQGHLEHFYHVRERFNTGERTAEHMLYLLARCVKGAVRYGKNGHFNQSPDKRRHGTNPQKIRASAQAVSSLLKGKISFSALDYRRIFDMAEPGDIVYMDPPYQGVSTAGDTRYCAGVEFGDFSAAVQTLNHRKIDYIISYDGTCGDKEYGEDLPPSLHCTKFLLKAGPSTQATLLGERKITYEALYVSENLVSAFRSAPKASVLAERLAL